MVYRDVFPGRFLSRPNRFWARVEIDGQAVVCHVKNTGRCRELLQPSVPVWCQHHDDPKRKTAWSLTTVQKGSLMVNLDSQAPNALALAYVRNGGLGFVPDAVRAEQVYNRSRFDLFYEAGDRKGFVEVKGVTLEQDGIASFPDAPTERGRKHLQELQQAASEGYEAWVLFVLQMSPMQSLRPNWQNDPQFAWELCRAAEHGVRVRAVECRVEPDELEVIGQVPVDLRPPEEGIGGVL